MTKGDKRDLACAGIITGVLTLGFVIVTWNVFWNVVRDPAAYERIVGVKYIIIPRPAPSDGEDRRARLDGKRVSADRAGVARESDSGSKRPQ